MIDITPVVLCGGSGTRLWPLSRMGLPKQFLSLMGDESLFQQTINRINKFNNKSFSIRSTLVVTNEEHRFVALQQFNAIDGVRGSFLLEPEGKNTAPALTLAALHEIESGNDPVLVVCPADQIVLNELAFTEALERGVKSAETGGIVIYGISPDYPEIGYGYIQQTGLPGVNGEFLVEQFKEKPDLETAKIYVLSKNYTWNSGIFILRASTWLNALSHFRNDILRLTKIAWKAKHFDGGFIHLNKEEFSQVPSESIDLAVLENCPSSIFPIHVIPLNAGWSDLGAWNAVWTAKQNGVLSINRNSVQGDVILIDTTNSLVYSTSRLVGTVGVNNLIVVETSDAVLIANRNESQQVKNLVKQLESSSRKELASHRKVHRPWGWYDNVDEGESFKVKRIQVNPGASLSLQMHHHRAEHWVVVRGIAEITNGDQVFRLTRNQSTYIPVGAIHRLCNPESTPLEIIEVQSGDYLGEDDIVRFEDEYGRDT